MVKTWTFYSEKGVKIRDTKNIDDTDIVEVGVCVCGWIYVCNWGKI